MEPALYLDYNASAPVKAEVAAAMAEALATCGNPSSAHRFGRMARRRVEEAREKIAALAHLQPEKVVFTSGGSEANALALGAGRGGVLIGATEHESVLRAAEGAPRLPVDPSGIVRRERLVELLAEASPALVSIQLANSETGVLQPIADLAPIVHAAGALLHVDAAQAFGRIEVDVPALGADLVTLSAHKMGGPQGIGALLVVADLAPLPLIRGGGQERGWRSGTENVPGIVGFGCAAELSPRDLGRAAALAALRDDLERQVLAAVPEAVIHGRAAPRLPNTSCIGIPGVEAETQVIAFDLAGIAVSAGSACSSGKLRRSTVLEAMGSGPQAAGSAIRVSLGPDTTAAETARFVEAWTRIHRRRALAHPRRATG